MCTVQCGSARMKTACFGSYQTAKSSNLLMRTVCRAIMSHRCLKAKADGSGWECVPVSLRMAYVCWLPRHEKIKTSSSVFLLRRTDCLRPGSRICTKTTINSGLLLREGCASGKEVKNLSVRLIRQKMICVIRTFGLLPKTTIKICGSAHYAES